MCAAKLEARAGCSTSSCRKISSAPPMPCLPPRRPSPAHRGDLLILYADTPLIEAETLSRLVAELDRGAAVAVLGFEARDLAATVVC